MNRYEILPADPDDFWLDQPGRWRPARTEDAKRHRVAADALDGSHRTATVSCPDCGGRASLSGHDIADDGRVSPSVVCPYDGCSFHEWTTLVGWSR